MEVSKERIYLDDSKSQMQADDLPAEVPDGFPRYHFFLFKHSFEGDYQESIGTCIYSTDQFVGNAIVIVHAIGDTLFVAFTIAYNCIYTNV